LFSSGLIKPPALSACYLQTFSLKMVFLHQAIREKEQVTAQQGAVSGGFIFSIF
jgi:hypothetical protein